MKNATRQPEAGLMACRMSDKWVTHVEALILMSDLQKTKGVIVCDSMTPPPTPPRPRETVGGREASVASFN